MAKQTINLGTGELTGDGESIRNAFGKINNNFDEVYLSIDSIITFSGDYNDLTNKPVLFSGSYNDLTDRPVLFDGNYNSLSNTPDLSQFVSRTEFNSGTITIDVNNTGDLQGSVFADDSTLLVDGVAGKIRGDIESSVVNITATDGDVNITAADDIRLITSASNNNIVLDSGSDVRLSGNENVTLFSNIETSIESNTVVAIYTDASNALHNFIFDADGYLKVLTDGGIWINNELSFLSAGVADATLSLNTGVLEVVTNNGFRLKNNVGDTQMEYLNTGVLNVIGTINGRLDGDITGSVFADNSTLLVDGVNGTIPWSVISDVQVTESDLLVDWAAIVGTQIQTNGLPINTFTNGNLEVRGILSAEDGSDLDLSSSVGVNINTSVGDENHTFEFMNDGTFYMAKNSVGNVSYISTPRNDANASLTLTSAIDLNIETNEGTGSIETWTFSADGTLTFPDATVQDTAYPGIPTLISSGETAPGTAVVAGETDIRFNFSGGPTALIVESDTLTIPANITREGSIDISTTDSPNTYTWNFGNDGTLTLPASSLGTNMGMIWSPADSSVWLSGTTVNKTTSGNGVVLNGGINQGTGNAGSISLFGGLSTGGGGGDIFIDAGVGAGSADNGIITIGSTNARIVSIGNGSNQTTINGNLTFDGTRTISPILTNEFLFGSDLNIQGGTSSDPDAVGGDLFIDGGAGAGAGIDGTVRINQNTSGGVWIGKSDGTADDIQTYSRLRIHRGVTEDYAAKADATGVVEHDCDGGHLFYHTSPDANWTVNLTNLNAYNNMATNITIIIVQGDPAYYPNALQIDGSAQTILWQGSAAPTPTANGVDVVTFSILYNGSNYTVLAQMTDFGAVP